jgi:SAM-dependent methyltransferase
MAFNNELRDLRGIPIMSAYDYPLYYEIAFSYQEVKRQVDFFQAVAKKFCDREAKSFLDLGCGPSPQLREVARRGYEAVGLDINPKMLAYLNEKAIEEGLRVETVQADMRDFKLGRKCDFAFCLSGSMKVNSNREFLKHLKCVADALNSCGIYLLENQALDISAPSGRQEWTMKRGEIEVRATFEMTMLDFIEQVSEGRLILDVVDHGESRRLVSVEKSKDFAPQELRSLVELSGYFEFLGFFTHLSLEPLRENFNDNVVLMRKKVA